MGQLDGFTCIWTLTIQSRSPSKRTQHSPLHSLQYHPPHHHLHHRSKQRRAMIDHLLGRPSPSWKRLQVRSYSNRPSSLPRIIDGLSYIPCPSPSSQVSAVITFWLYQLFRGSKQGPRLLWIKNLNRFLSQFSDALSSPASAYNSTLLYSQADSHHGRSWWPP